MTNGGFSNSINLFLLKIHLTFYFKCIDVKVSDPLELELEAVVSCHMDAGN